MGYTSDEAVSINRAEQGPFSCSACFTRLSLKRILQSFCMGSGLLQYPCCKKKIDIGLRTRGLEKPRKKFYQISAHGLRKN